MARTDTVGRTLATDPDSPVDHDVLVIGGGAAGLSAATFLARYGFDTLVLARGKSAIGQCAHLENYLGFPAGITPEQFLALGRTQVEHEGGTVAEASNCTTRHAFSPSLATTLRGHPYALHAVRTCSQLAVLLTTQTGVVRIWRRKTGC